MDDAAVPITDSVSCIVVCPLVMDTQVGQRVELLIIEYRNQDLCVWWMESGDYGHFVKYLRYDMSQFTHN